MGIITIKPDHSLYEKQKSETGKYTPCLSGVRTLCYNQVMTTNSFTSQEAKQTFNIFFNLNCTSGYIIYLVECILCKMQYVGKAETAFNLRFNNHRKDEKKSSYVLASKHLQEQGHNFNKHFRARNWRDGGVLPYSFSKIEKKSWLWSSMG